jgi:hypothetical protein
MPYAIPFFAGIFFVVLFPIALIIVCVWGVKRLLSSKKRAVEPSCGNPSDVPRERHWISLTLRVLGVVALSTVALAALGWLLFVGGCALILTGAGK